MKKKIVIIILAIIVLGLGGYLGWIIINNDNNNSESNASANNETSDVKNEVQKANINSELSKVKLYAYDSDGSKFYLAGYTDYDYYHGGGGEYVKIVELDNPKVDAYEYGGKIYLTYIDNSKYIIKYVDITKGNGIYNIEDYKQIEMPSDYKICGLWEGTREDNICGVSSYFTENYIYFATRNGSNERIYLVDRNTFEIRSIYLSEGQYSLKTLSQLSIVQDKLVVATVDGIFCCDLDGSNLKNIFKLNGEPTQSYYLVGRIPSDRKPQTMSGYYVYNDKIYYNVRNHSYENGYSEDIKTYYYDLITGKNEILTEGGLVGVYHEKLVVVNGKEIYVYKNDKKINTISINAYNGIDSFRFTYVDDRDVEFYGSDGKYYYLSLDAIVVDSNKELTLHTK